MAFLQPRPDARYAVWFSCLDRPSLRRLGPLAAPPCRFRNHRKKKARRGQMSAWRTRITNSFCPPDPQWRAMMSAEPEASEKPVHYCLSCLLLPQLFNCLTHKWPNCPMQSLEKPPVRSHVISLASLDSASATVSQPVALCVLLLHATNRVR